jgi:hypothetical protein
MCVEDVWEAREINVSVGVRPERTCRGVTEPVKLVGVSVKASFAYIGVPPRAGPATNSVYLEPSFDLQSVMPESVLTIKKSEPRTVEEAWTRILEGVCANPGMRKEELTSMMSMVSRPVSFVPKTPPARKRSLSEDDEFPAVKRMSPFRRSRNGRRCHRHGNGKP